MIRTILLLIAVSFPMIGTAETSFPAPFGLSWELSEAELTSLGFARVTETSGLTIYSSVSAPKAWSKADTYMAIVYKGRLVKVVATSTEFTNDVYGSKGKEVYNQLKSLLTKKYGEPSQSMERTGLSLYDDSDEFYQCLEYSGCGVYSTIFALGGGTIGITLNGKRRGEGNLTIGYESPEFSRAKAEIDRGDEAADEDAL